MSDSCCNAVRLFRFLGFGGMSGRAFNETGHLDVHCNLVFGKVLSTYFTLLNCRVIL